MMETSTAGVGGGIVVGLIGLTKIIIGSSYLHDCSIQNKIPIFLIISALSPLFFGLMISKNSTQIFAGGVAAVLINIAVVVCEIVWVFVTFYTVHKDTYVPCQSVNGTLTPQDCTEGTCNNTLLNASFTFTIMDIIIILVFLLVVKYNTSEQIQNSSPNNTSGDRSFASGKVEPGYKFRAESSQLDLY